MNAIIGIVIQTNFEKKELLFMKIVFHSYVTLQKKKKRDHVEWMPVKKLLEWK